MSGGENILLALTSIRANKMRAALTMLGIIIGIAAVIAIMTLGNSLTGTITTQMQSFGVGNISVYVQSTSDDFGRIRGAVPGMGGADTGPAEEDLISDEMLAALREAYPDEISAYSLSESVDSGQTTDGRKYANLSLMGANPEYAEANNIELVRGRFVSERDEENRKNVVVVSDKLVENMFGSENPLGQQITIQGQSHTYSFAIVGVYESSDEMLGPTSSSSEDVQTDAYIPISTAQRITGTAGYQSMTVVTTSGTNATEFAETIKTFLGKYYARNDDYEVSTYSSESAVETMTDMLNSISLAIAAIAAISLLVGGIGVMNIMLVSITERTREIGVRKALGATNGEIRAQFIIEAMVICFIGGVIGIVAGVILGAIGTQFLGTLTGTDMDLTVSVPVPMMILAAGVSMAIGVFFGYYPANKAAKLDPIDALRFE